MQSKQSKNKQTGLICKGGHSIVSYKVSALLQLMIHMIRFIDCLAGQLYAQFFKCLDIHI